MLSQGSKPQSRLHQAQPTKRDPALYGQPQVEVAEQRVLEKQTPAKTVPDQDQVHEHLLRDTTYPRETENSREGSLGQEPDKQAQVTQGRQLHF